MLVLVALIALVISGIGIMNIMLVTVTERTREIGIRKAIGATRDAIRYQFLMEAMVISGMGALAGILIAIAIPLLLNFLIAFHTRMPAMLAFRYPGFRWCWHSSYPAPRAFYSAICRQTARRGSNRRDRFIMNSGVTWHVQMAMTLKNIAMRAALGGDDRDACASRHPRARRIRRRSPCIRRSRWPCKIAAT